MYIKRLSIEKEGKEDFYLRIALRPFKNSALKKINRVSLLRILKYVRKHNIINNQDFGLHQLNLFIDF